MKALTTLTRLAVLAVAVFLSAAAVAVPRTDTLPHVKQAEREALISLYVRTRMCMSRANQAMLRQGFTDQGFILAFSRQSCGPGLRQFLVSPVGWSAADADAFIEELTRRELVITLGAPLI